MNQNILLSLLVETFKKQNIAPMDAHTIAMAIGDTLPNGGEKEQIRWCLSNIASGLLETAKKLIPEGENKERVIGYYSVQPLHDNTTWVVGKWDGKSWQLMGRLGNFSDNEIHDIGDRLEWKSVEPVKATEKKNYDPI